MNIPTLLDALSRRRFLLSSGAMAAVACAAPNDCSRFPDYARDAYTPWEWPALDETRPEMLAAAAALLAANPHNTQPWRFRVDPDRIDVFADLDRNLGAMDGLRRELHLGVGCGVENAVRAAAMFGLHAAVDLLPDPSDPTLVARLELSATDPVDDPLCEVIPCRHTDRGEYEEGEEIPGLRKVLAWLLDEPDVRLTVVDDPASMEVVRRGTLDATAAINADAEMSADGHHWYRHKAKDIEAHRDGVTLAATGNPWLIRAFGRTGKGPEADAAGEYWYKATEKRQLTASAFVILGTVDRYDRSQQLAAGRIYQRLALWATSQGLATQPLNQLPEQQDRDEVLGRAPTWGPLLEELVRDPDQGVQMIFRIGRSVHRKPPFASPRRSIEEVLG